MKHLKGMLWTPLSILLGIDLGLRLTASYVYRLIGITWVSWLKWDLFAAALFGVAVLASIYHGSRLNRRELIKFIVVCGVFAALAGFVWLMLYSLILGMSTG